MLKYFISGILFISMQMLAYGQFTKASSENTNNSKSKPMQFYLGSNVGISSDKSYFIQNYFNPVMPFRLHKNFTLLTGIGVINTQWNNIPNYGNEVFQSTNQLNFTSVYAFASGVYHVNEHLDLNTRVLYEKILLQSNETPDLLQDTGKELALGFHYKVSSNFSFNAQVNFTNRPYSPFGYYNPSYTSPFTGFFPLFP